MCVCVRERERMRMWGDSAVGTPVSESEGEINMERLEGAQQSGKSERA